MLDYGWRVVGLCINVQRVVAWFSVWLLLSGGEISCPIQVVNNLQVEWAVICRPSSPRILEKSFLALSLPRSTEKT